MESPSFNITIRPDFWTRYRAMRTMTNRMWGMWVVYALVIAVPGFWVAKEWVNGTDGSPPGTLGFLTVLPLVGMVLGVIVLVPLLQMYQLWAISRRNRALLGQLHFAFAP